jgi:hypothetical protein
MYPNEWLGLAILYQMVLAFPVISVLAVAIVFLMWKCGYKPARRPKRAKWITR